MKGRNHFVVGIATALLAQGALPFIHTHTLLGVPVAPGWMLLPVLGSAAVGGLMPDIDLATSLIAHETGTGRGQGCLTGLVWHWIRKLLGGHRGLTHSLLAGLACVLVMGLNVGTLHLGDLAVPLNWDGLLGSWSDFGTAFTLGYLSHILVDMLTKEGVKFGYPFSHVGIGLGPRGLRFSNGSWPEYLWVLALVMAGLWPWLYRVVSGWM
jgi:membrane-bound metal-dependent hydrolase YbcI (DUF457 family)